MRIAHQLKYRPGQNVPFLVSVVRGGYLEVGFWNCLIYGLIAWSLTSFYYEKKLEDEGEKRKWHRRYPGMDKDIIY